MLLLRNTIAAQYNTLVLINVVTVRRARLVLGRVTDCGHVKHFGV